MFASRPHDPDTGLINMRARWYSPDIGRFLSPDPAGLVDGTNLYAYASNDPVDFFDPSGLARQATQDNPGLGNSDQSLLALQSLLATFRAKVRSYLRGETAFNAEQINGLIHGYAVDLGTSLLDALPIGSGPFADAARAYAAAQISVAVSAVDLAGGLLATVADPISIVRGILRLGEGSAMGMQEIQRGNVVMGVSMITAEVAAVVGLAAGGVAGARAIAGGPVGAPKKGAGSFIDEMAPDEAARYKKYWEGHAPEQGAPFEVRRRYTPEGNTKQVTTYDEYGRRHRQYDLLDPRRPEHQHNFDYDARNPLGTRSDHLPIDE